MGESPQMNIKDPMYCFLTERLHLTFCRILLLLLIINVIRSLLVPAVHYNLYNHHLLWEHNNKDVQSWIASFIVQPILLYVYWHTIFRIPFILQELYRCGAVKVRPNQKQFPEFLKDVEAVFHNRRGRIYWLVAVIAALLFFNTSWPRAGDFNNYGPVGAYPYNFFWQILENPHGFFLYSLVAWSAWRILKFGEAMRLLWQDFDIEIELYHPDNAGGLGVVGGFTLPIGLIVGAIRLFILATYWGSPQGLDVVLIIIISTVVWIIISVAAFVYPLWHTHQAMKAWFDHYQGEVVQAFNQRWHDVHQKLDESIDEDFKSLSTLDELRELNGKAIRVWPFRRITLVRYIETLAPIWLFLLTKLVPGIAPLVEAVFNLVPGS